MPGYPNKTNGEGSKRAGRKPWGEDEEHPVAGPKRKIAEEDDQAKAAAREQKTEVDAEIVGVVSVADRESVDISLNKVGCGFVGRAVPNAGQPWRRGTPGHTHSKRSMRSADNRMRDFLDE